MLDRILSRVRAFLLFVIVCLIVACSTSEGDDRQTLVGQMRLRGGAAALESSYPLRGGFALRAGAASGASVAPHPRRHHSWDCALRIDEPVIGCPGDDWPVAATFELLPADPELPDPSQNSSYTANISADGRVISGQALIANNPNGAIYAPALWMNGTLRLLPGMNSNAYPGALNCDGSAVFISNATDPGGSPVRWTTDTITTLPTLVPNAWLQSCSASGDIVVGSQASPERGPGTQVVRWQNDIPSVIPFAGSVFPFGISADGQFLFVVQRSLTCSGDCPDSALRWTESGGEQLLFSGHNFVNSSDGTTIAGNLDAASHSVTILNPSRGNQVIDCPVESCLVEDMSSRGRVLLLQAFHPYSEYESSSSWIWTSKHGARELRELLVAYGAQIDPAISFIAYHMSDDARVFVGTARAGSNDVAFRAALPRAAYE